MQRSTTFSFAVLAATAALVLVGCSASPGNVPVAEAPAGTETSDDTGAGNGGGEAQAILSIGDASYTVQLQFCSLTGKEDALFHGLAFDSAGTEVGYLEGDFVSLSSTPFGEARIDFGATRKLQSMDEFVAMGSPMGDIAIADLSDSTLTVTGNAWDQNGTQLGGATLKLTC